VIHELGVGVLRIDGERWSDARGSFRELWRADGPHAAHLPGPFVQDNVSVSRAGVLRGLHFQHPHPQGKMVTVVRGSVWDVAVDVRPGSETFGRWVAAALNAGEPASLRLPPGMAHGFVALEEDAVVVYKCTETYQSEAEGTLRWAIPSSPSPGPWSGRCSRTRTARPPRSPSCAARSGTGERARLAFRAPPRVRRCLRPATPSTVPARARDSLTPCKS